MWEDARGRAASAADGSRDKPHGRRCHVTVKPVGALCVLNCSYCYYAQADKLTATGARKSAVMSDATVERLIDDLLAASDAPEIHLCWHGGEPLLAGMSFYRRVVESQARRCPPGRRFVNALQTSGVGLDAEWTRFLGEHGFLVGLSIDGPKFLHDRCRRDRMGRSRFAATLAAAERLLEAGVAVNSLTTVGAHNFDHGARIYRFLKALGFRFMQFIPVVERMDASGRPAPPPGMARAGETRSELAPWSVPAEGYGRFLCEVFDVWSRRDRARISVQSFDLLTGAMLGAPSGLCVHAETCGDCLALEADGSLYACDHYVYPDYHLGRLGAQSLGEMAGQASQRAFGQWKRTALPDDCTTCAFRRACHGGCPKHRFVAAETGPARNYLCPSYRRFFAHVAPRLMASAEGGDKRGGMNKGVARAKGGNANRPGPVDTGPGL